MGFAPRILESGLHSVLLFLCIMLHMPGSFFDSVGQFCSMRCIEVKGAFARLVVEPLELLRLGLEGFLPRICILWL